MGLTLDEGKAILAELQRRLVQSQIDEQIECARVCTDCMGMRQIRDRRPRTLQTLFGTVTVQAPRLKLCTCVDAGIFYDLPISPLSKLRPDRCTPEVRRLQSELAARHSFREPARLPATFLPCSPPNHASVRNRLHPIASELEAADINVASDPNVIAEPSEEADPAEMVVFNDGAHIRATPGHQTQYLDVTVGKIEVSGRSPRRFGLASRGADHPLSSVRAALFAQGWKPGRPVTVILDWFHISMRVRHIEQKMAVLYSMKPENTAPLDYVSFYTERLRHVLWNEYHEEAREHLWDLKHVAGGIPSFNGDRFERPIRSLLGLFSKLRGYLQNNEASIACYHQRYHAKLPVSASRAEGCVDEIANARMAKRRRMRWSPVGVHRVTTVRAAVLDGRYSALHAKLAA